MQNSRAQEVLTTELDLLVTPTEKEFLLSELARIQPPERLRELAGYGQRQSDLGGGFYGMMPDQLADPDSIPLPTDAGEILEAALCLARQRRDNLEALEQLNPDYALSFRGNSLADFLETISEQIPAPGDDPTKLHLELDVSALDGFFRALADGDVSAGEAASLASLPSNQAMLEHRRNLGYVPEPLPDTKSLAEMIRMAGSSDPLDRLWWWINSQNAFDYADLAQNEDGFRQLLTELDAHGDALVDAAVARIADFTPPGMEFEATFAMTVGWAIRGWVTPDMAGLNIEQTKDDWPFLFGTMVEETYHRLQLELFPSPSGVRAQDFSELVEIDTGDARYDRLFEIVTYTVAEGAANRVRGPFAATDLEEKVPAGAELMARFVRQVVNEGDLDAADALINEGLKGNGPLYGLGWKLAGVIAEREGTQAVGTWQQQGPVAFFLHGANLSAEEGNPFISPEVTAAVDSLKMRLGNLSR
jgi:hypothetical protein